MEVSCKGKQGRRALLLRSACTPELSRDDHLPDPHLTCCPGRLGARLDGPISRAAIAVMGHALHQSGSTMMQSKGEGDAARRLSS